MKMPIAISGIVGMYTVITETSEKGSIPASNNRADNIKSLPRLARSVQARGVAAVLRFPR
jgi:hypothetical protein